VVTLHGLIERLHARHRQFSREDCHLIVKTLLAGITAHLAAGGRVEIRGFGSFEMRARAAKTARNPKTGASVAVPLRHVPHFKAGKDLRNSVKNKGGRKNAPPSAASDKWGGLLSGTPEHHGRTK
jgi:integration host factor subunit beta